MQQRKASGPISGRKGVASRQQNIQSQSHQTNNQNPQKDQQEYLFNMVKQYLDKNGYPRTFQSLKHQKPLKKSSYAYGVQKQTGSNFHDQEKSILLHLDKGHRQEFFKLTNKIFMATNSTNTSQNFSQQYMHYLRKLQFQLNIYFCIYSIHPCIGNQHNKKSIMDKSAAEAFKKFINTKGSEMSEGNQLLQFFALPYLPKPQQNPGMAKVFTKQWITKLRNNVIQLLKESNASKKNLNQGSVNKENKKLYNSCLQQMYDKYLHLSSSEKQQKSVEDQCFNSQHTKQIEQLRKHNRQMASYLDIMQQNLKQLNDASKTNLIQSNKKWFQFSKQILQLAKKVTKNPQDKSSIQRLQKYQKFFGFNIDQLIYSSADISLFQKNSYTQDVSNMYDAAKRMVPNIQSNKQQTICQVDINKILNLFSRANKPQLEREVCLVLKALKDRLYIQKSAHSRRQVIVSYQRNDLCAIKQCNYHYQKKILLQSGQNVRQFYLRLINHISTDNLGNQYLSSSQKLIQNLIGIMGETNQDVIYRKHVFGLLQRFSFIKKSQLTMISFGIIPMIFKVFRSEGQNLQYSSIVHLMGLIMNLAINKESIKNFQKHKSEIIAILLKYIEMDDAQIQGFINGTLYVLLQLKSIKDEAVEKYKMNEIIKQLLHKTQLKLKQIQQLEQNSHNDDVNSDSPQDQIDDCNIVIRQYNYLLERLQNKNNQQFQANQYEGDAVDDEDQDQDLDQLQQMDLNSNNQSCASDYIQGQENALAGQELLLKKYALLGPEAVREELLTRSILDETGRKSHNMTTSINHSKRIDKVFNKNEKVDTPSLLPNNLDLSINPGKQK